MECRATRGQSSNSLKLAVQWPPTYCLANPGLPSCRSWIHRFTLHGLWQDTPPSAPCSFPNPDLPLMYIPLLELMAVSWPDLKGNDMQFWLSEWNKHGCYLRYLPPGYFLTAIMALNALNLDGHAINFGLYMDQPLDAAYYYSAMKSITRKDVQLVCVQNIFLLEIRICYDEPNGVLGSIIDCPYVPPTCGSQIIMPP